MYAVILLLPAGWGLDWQKRNPNLLRPVQLAVLGIRILSVPRSLYHRPAPVFVELINSVGPTNLTKGQMIFICDYPVILLCILRILCIL